MAEYTVDDFKKQYPNGVVVDLKEWDKKRIVLRDKKKVALVLCATHSLAVVDYSSLKKKLPPFYLDGHKVLWLHNNQNKTMWLSFLELDGTLYRPLNDMTKLAYKVRNAIADVYPQKQTSYKFESALTKADFDILADVLPLYARNCKMNPQYSSTGKIEVAEIYLESSLSSEEIIEILQNKIKTEDLFKDDTSENPPEFCESLLEGFPEKAKVFRVIPRKTLTDRFSSDCGLLPTIVFRIKSIHWLYKLSETTLGIPSDPRFNEIHVILVNYSYPCTTGRNRRIGNRTFTHTYHYGISFCSEEKFLTYLDKLIPYQTVYILKVSYEGSEYYQIWSGIKNMTAKGMTVKQYYHSEWISAHRYSNTESSAKNPFTLSLEGNDLKNVMYNFIDQLIGKKKAATPKTESTPKPQNQISAEKQNKSTPPVKKEKPSLSRFDTPDTISNRKKMLMHTHILEKLEDVLRNNFSKSYYDFEISHYFSPKTIEDFKKTETKIMLDGMDEQKTLSAYDVEIAACKEMARLLSNYFNFEFSADNDVITITKKIRTDFTKAMLIHEIGKFYIFS